MKAWAGPYKGHIAGKNGIIHNFGLQGLIPRCSNSPERTNKQVPFPNMVDVEISNAMNIDRSVVSKRC